MAGANGNTPTATGEVFDRFCERLQQVTGQPVRHGKARCPAHDDTNPSLSVTHDSTAGRVLVHCHAGCPIGDIVAALGLTTRDLTNPTAGNTSRTKSQIVETYDYTDESGQLLFQVVRRRPKAFPQRRPDGWGGWIWNLGEVRRVLYRLPEVLAAVADGQPIMVCEGEKDVHAAEAAGWVATTNPGGAGKWRDPYTRTLAGAEVTIVADADDAGRSHARDVAGQLSAAGCIVQLLEPATGHGDLAEHLGAGRSVDDLQPLPPADAEPALVGAEASKPERAEKSAATVLIDLARETYRFAASTTGEVFGEPIEGPPVTFLLRGGRQSLRAELARLYFDRHHKAASSSALADAMLTLEGIAQRHQADLHLRTAAHHGTIWVDIGDDTGRAIRIDPTGWAIEPEAPVLFKRTALNLALPEPVRGHDLDELWKLLNVDPADRPLVAAWLVAALFPDVPHPAMALLGEQGTGKSTATKLLVSIVDPSPVPARKPPKDPESWITSANASWVVALDNLSTMPDWLSDSLCRAVTGDGDIRRRLYTDADLAVFAVRRAILFNGIDLGSLRGDLADRMLPVHLALIEDTARLEEADLWRQWHTAHPRVLGALLDLTAAALAELPTVQLTARPRMADFARILAAVDTVLGTNGLSRYLTKQGALAADSLDGDDFMAALTTTITDTFEGTSGDLHRQIERPDDATKWPGNARAITTRLRRWAPVLRKVDWTITDDDGQNKAGVLRWTITPPAKDPTQ